MLCALLGVGLLLSGWFPQERLRLLAERQIRQAIGPGSRIGALHVVPGRLWAEVTDLVIEGPTYRIEAPRARVRASWALVMGRGIDLQLLEAKGARITLRPPRRTSRRPPCRACASPACTSRTRRSSTPIPRSRAT